MTRQPARVLGAVGSALVALVLSHSLVFLIRYGSAYGEALAHAGHDAAWTIAIASSSVLGLGLALAGTLQLRRLARAAGPAPDSDGGSGRRRFVARWLRLSARTAATTSVLLTIQENLERASVGLPTPGLGLLVSADYPWAVAVIAAVGLAVGLVVALFRWQRDVLIARLRAARGIARSPVDTPPPGWFAPRRSASVLGRAQGLRAPPRVAAA